MATKQSILSARIPQSHEALAYDLERSNQGAPDDIGLVCSIVLDRASAD